MSPRMRRGPDLYEAVLYLAGTFFTAAAAGFSQNNMYVQYSRMYGKPCRISVLSLWVEFFRGTRPAISTLPVELTEPFKLPVLWSFSLICFFLVIGKTAEKMRGAAYQQILRTESRKKWAGKICRTLAVQTLRWYGCILASTGIVVLCFKGTLLPAETDAFLYLNDVTNHFLSPVFLCLVFILSIVSLMAIAFLQAAVTFGLSSVTGVMVSAAAMAASVFWNKWFFLCQYVQFVRMQPESLLPGYFLAALMISGCTLLIYLRIHRMDFLEL